MSKHGRGHRADDKRRPGMGDNTKFKVTQDTNGAGPALSEIFNDRRKPNGKGKKAF